MNPVAATPARAPGTRLVKAGAVAFIAVVASWVIYAVASGKNGALDPVDLTVYRDGGLIVRHMRPYYDPHAAAPLYDWGGYSSLALKFTYPPFAAVFFALISFIPWTPLWVLSVIVNIVSLLAALWFTFGGLGYRDRRVLLGATLVAAAVTFWLQPVVRTIYLGQINLLLMAAIIWDLCQPREGRWWKGLATGVAAGIKLVPLIFVPYLLVTRKFREAAMTVAGFAATVLIGFVILPSDSSKWWLHGMVFSDGNRTGFTGWAGNQSLRGLITRLSGSIHAGMMPWLAAAAVALVLGIGASQVFERAGYHMVAILVAALTGLLISPISWDHHWVWVAPGVAVTGHYAIMGWKSAGTNAQRWHARWLAALAVGMIFVYGAWPDAIWEKARNLGKFSFGFLWAQKNTNPILFSKYGDQPRWVEYHWHGFQLLWGNIYILGGMALLIVLLVLAFRLRAATPATSAPETSALPASVPPDRAQPAYDCRDALPERSRACSGWFSWHSDIRRPACERGGFARRPARCGARCPPGNFDSACVEALNDAQTPARKRGVLARKPRGPQESASRVLTIPRSGQVVATQMWTMLAASCLTVFGIGAEIGVMGVVLGFTLDVAPLYVRWCALIAAIVLALLALAYGFCAIRTLADSRDGSTMSNAGNSSFTL